MTIRRGNLLGATALVVALAALTVAIFAAAYRRQVTSLDVGREQTDADTTDMIGLSAPAAKNALDPRYTDANGDLVADPPANPAQRFDPAALTFSYVDDSPAFKDAFVDVLTALSKATGRPVTYVTYADTAARLRALRDGQLALCGASTGTVPLAVCTAGFVPLVETVDAQGNVGSPMLIIAPANSPLTSLADLRGHRLLVTETNSNSGYKAPLVLLREHGLIPPRDYGLSFSYSHNTSIARVKAGDCDAAAVAGDVLQIEQAAGHIAPADYKVLYTSDQTFPGAAIGCSNRLDPALVAKVRAALLAFNFHGTSMTAQGVFADGSKVRFVPADYKKDWQYVRLIDDSFGSAYALPAANPPATRAAP